ncbi:MAG: class I SAM-dependent methyltransferase [Methylophilus sp.]
MIETELFSAKNLPVFQNKVFDSRDAAVNCITGNVTLVQNSTTGLIYNNNFDQSLMEYDQDYQNEQAYSNAFKNHLSDVAKIIKRNFLTDSIIEVGCGKGYFLEYLNQSGFNVTGIDPTYEGNNQKVIKKYFDPSLGLKADAIILRHVLEHIQNPVAFLKSIATTNGNNGRIYIEVPCFDWICEHKAWFDIFYEHVNYFRIADFFNMFDNVIESGHIFGGQYLYIVADLASLKSPIASDADILQFPKDFLSTINSTKLIDSSNSNVIWGGASKGVIFAIYMQRIGVNIDYVIDINPAKQGKYLGVSGLKVFSPKEALENLGENTNIFIMNSNYSNEIMELSHNRFNYIKVD